MEEKTKFNRRLDRILKAVSLEKTDRVPVVLEYAGFAANVTQTPMSEFVKSQKNAIQTMLRAYELIGGGDAINYGSYSPYALCYIFGAKVRVPGVELPKNDEPQVVESELMNREDYDRILRTGWLDFFEDFLSERVFNDTPQHLLPINQESAEDFKLWKDRGIPVIQGGVISSSFELLCGARSLEKFFYDLVDMPDKVEAVMDAMAPYMAEWVCQSALKSGFPTVWVGGWRSAPFLISPPMWERFVWPYLRKIILEVVDSGLIALLHLDSNWDRELARFKELPKGKLIVALDGDTDIHKAKEILDGHACIMGDVPASMFAFGTPEEVYTYCKKLIREIGPDGFILQSGCDIPTNAKLENVQAMVSAARES
ncbi:MAG: uroporphyrinogen decarboxylase [Deltaproteobacteria bacterium]|nr:uroporphyrinogen decarboxylase [Deltaproteobacteria bacterium]